MKKRAFGLTLSEEDWQALHKVAKLRNMSAAEWVRAFLGDIARDEAQDIECEQKGQIVQYLLTQTEGLFGDGI